MNRRMFLRNSAIGMGAMARVGFNGHSNELGAEELNAHPPSPELPGWGGRFV